MSKVTINGKECTAYYGDHKEVTVYNGSTKLYGAESQTKTGSTVVFDDTYNGNGVESLTLTGSNMEGATTGAQLINPRSDYSTELSGVQITITNGVVHVEGTYEGDTQAYTTLGTVTAEEGKTYTISGVEGYATNKFQIFCTSSDAFPVGNRLQCYNGPVTRTALGTETVNVDIYVYSGVTINETFYIQVQEGTTATAYEPYTGGLPAPNLYYPLTETVSASDDNYSLLSIRSEYPYYVNSSIGTGTFTKDGNQYTFTVESVKAIEGVTDYGKVDITFANWAGVFFNNSKVTSDLMYSYRNGQKKPTGLVPTMAEWLSSDSDQYIEVLRFNKNGTGRTLAYPFSSSGYGTAFPHSFTDANNNTVETTWLSAKDNYAFYIGDRMYFVKALLSKTDTYKEFTYARPQISYGKSVVGDKWYVNEPDYYVFKVPKAYRSTLLGDNPSYEWFTESRKQNVIDFLTTYYPDYNLDCFYPPRTTLATTSTSTVTLDAPHKKADFVTGKIVDSGSTTGGVSVDNIGFDLTYDNTYSGLYATHWKAEYNKDTREAVVSVTYDQDMPTTGAYSNVNVCETKFPFADGTYNTGTLYSGTQTTSKSHVPAYFIHTDKWATSDKKALWVFAFKTGTGVRPSFAGGYGNQCTFRVYNQDKTTAKTVGGSRVETGAVSRDNGYTYYLLTNSYTDSELATLDWYYLGEFSWQVYDYPFVTSVARTAGTYYWKMTEPFMTIIPFSDMSETTQAMFGTPNQYGNPTLASGVSAWGTICDALEAEGLLPTYEPFTGGLPAPNEYYNSDGTEHDSNYDVGEYPNYYDLVDTHISQYKTTGTGLTWTVDGTSISSGTTVTTSENPYSITVNNSTGSAVDAIFDVLSSGFDMYMPSYAEFFAMTDKQPYFLIGFDDASSDSSVTGNMRIEAFSGFNSSSSSIFGTNSTYSVFAGLPTYKGRKYICCPMFKMLRAVDDTTDVIKLRLVATSVPTDTTLYVKGLTISIIYLDAMTASELTPYFNNVSSSITAQCQPTASYNTFFNTYVAPYIAGIDKLDQTYYPSVTITGGDPSKTVKVSDTSDD